MKYDWLIAKGTEASTWAGLALILGQVGIVIAPEVWGPAQSILTGIAGLALVYLRERPKP